MTFALDYMREAGMDVAMVEAGYDTGHAQAEALYESTGFTLAPAVRYFRLLDNVSHAPDRDVQDAIEIRKITERDVDRVVEFSVRAWAAAFASMRRTFGDPIFLRLYPDWETNQAATVRASCTGDTANVFVAAADGRPIGLVAITLDAHRERMGEVSIIAVDPDYQRRGIGERLTTFALNHMRDRGMDSAIVETGNDPGHAPARALYASTGFTPLPVARYFRLLT